MATAAAGIDERMGMQRREEARRLKEGAVLRRAVTHNGTGAEAASAKGATHAAAAGSSRATGQPVSVIDPRQLRRVMSGRSCSYPEKPMAGAPVASPSTRAGSGPLRVAGSGGPLESSRSSSSNPSSAGARTYSGGDIGDAGDKAASAVAAEQQQKLRMSARQLRGVGLPAAAAPNSPLRRATHSPERQVDKEAQKQSDLSNRMLLRAQLRGTPSSTNTGPSQAPASSHPAPSHQAHPASGTQQSMPSPAFKSLRASSGRVPSPVINNAPTRSSRPAMNNPPQTFNMRQTASRPGTPDIYIPPRPASACSYTSSASSFATHVTSPTETKRTPALVSRAPRPATSSAAYPPPTKSASPPKAEPMKAYSPWEAGDAVHALRAARKKLGREAFIEYIYTNHPPKDPSKKLNTKLDVKKQMQKALSHYHPDKQNMLEHGPEWCLICEEVCKEITRMYKKRASPH
mmetsp:Transcript_21184/g.58808  ORF Transcript_21184/g.58808 Transcript_21184/m.58808 type:complete len:460 (-) Transcript_21184:299-1678(-)